MTTSKGQSYMQAHHDAIITMGKEIMDTLSIGALIGYFFGWLPHIATLLTVIWAAIRIWETDTIRKFRGLPPLEERS